MKYIGFLWACFFMCLFFQTYAMIVTDFHVVLQNPSYITQRWDLADDILVSWTGTLYTCDISKSECKLNIKIEEPDLTALSSKISCRITFDFDELVLETCNPNTIIIPAGMHQMSVEVYESQAPENISKQEYVMSNGVIEKEPDLISDEAELSQKYMSDEATIWEPKLPDIPVIDIPNFDYIFQSPSYVTLVDDVYICDQEKPECKINLKLIQSENQKDISTTLDCSIDFGFDSDQSERCNPNTVIIPVGTHTISLQIFDSDTPDQLKQESFVIQNIPVEAPVIVTETIKSSGWNIKTSIQNHFVSANIIIQSKNTSTRTVEVDRVICLKSKKCNLNLSSLVESDSSSSQLTYAWDFWNGEYSAKANPSGVWFEPGEYDITFKVSDEYWNQSSSQVFLGAYETLSAKIFKPDDYSWLLISWVLANTLGKDENEWIEIHNSSWNIISLEWLIIDDEMWKGSQGYEIGEGVSIEPDQKIKFYKKQTKITFWNTSDSAVLHVAWEVIDSYSWDFAVPENFILAKDSLEIQRLEVLVTRVVDWDTVVIQFQNQTQAKLRLTWVDTPETKHPFKPLEFFGKQASDFTQLSLEWKIVYVDILPGWDKYGRRLWYIYQDNESQVSFNEILIEQGYARAYVKYPFAYSSQFEKAQARAKKSQLWIWSQTDVKREILALNREDKKLLEGRVDQSQDFSDIFTHISIYNTLLENTSQSFKSSLYQSVSWFKLHADFAWVWEIPEITSQHIETDQNLRVNFSQSILQQKKSLKIYGKTSPDTQIEILFWDELHTIVSDEKWNYSLKLSKLQSWAFEIHSRVLLGDAGVYEVPRIKSVVLSPEYVDEVNTLNLKLALEKSKITSKTKSSWSSSPTQSIVTQSWNTPAYDTLEPVSTIRFGLLYVLMWLLSWLMWYMVLRKWRIV